MARIGSTSIDGGDAAPNVEIAWTEAAREEVVAEVLALDPDSDHGRSEWQWIRLANGDLILGVFPQGDGYFMHEDQRTI